MSASSTRCSELGETKGGELRSHSWEGPSRPGMLSWRVALGTSGWE